MQKNINLKEYPKGKNVQRTQAGNSQKEEMQTSYKNQILFPVC